MAEDTLMNTDPCLYVIYMSDFSYEKAMDIYYSSKLSDKVYTGKEGIQYLDYKVLVQILMETEKELFDGEL